jgi:hypothetical protein
MERVASEDSDELIKWLDALDMLVGLWRTADLDEAIGLARSCRHHDAQWLCSLLPAGPVWSWRELREVMLAQGDDPRALTIAAMAGDVPDHQMLRRAAELGYAPAQAAMVHVVDRSECLEWAAKAASQNDRNGLSWMGVNFTEGLHGEVDLAKGLALFRRAAELGHTDAQMWMAYECAEDSPERYVWLLRAALGGSQDALKRVRGLAVTAAKNGNRKVQFEIGAACAGNVNGAVLFAFGSHTGLDEWNALQQAVVLHKKTCELATAAIHCWLLVARRLRVVKDIRVLIARVLRREQRSWVNYK